nr:cupin domain-containing protein [Cellulomonas endophytica]
MPGGVSLSRLAVYDWPAPDGVGRVGSGSPHLHLASTEAYVALGGSGSVHTLGADGLREHPLTPGSVVTFAPGTVHRAVNDGDLDVLVLMSNAGLPEAGDAVLTFPADVLADPARYAAAVALPGPEAPDDVRAAAARRRRDLALEGWAALLAAVDDEGPARALAPLHAAAVALVRRRVPGWRDTWTGSVAAATAATDAALAALAVGSGRHLAGARADALDPAPGPRRYGMCGRLQTWPLGG